MSITTFEELKTAVGNWLVRSDLADRVPDFISLAEAGFNRKIRHRNMIETTTLTTVAGTATVALPNDFLEARTLILQTDPRVTLSYKAPQQLSQNFAGASDTGRPIEYTITGDNLKLGKTPDAAYDIELEYFQRIPALSDSVADNWLLTRNPDVYLYGALMASAPFIRKDERLMTWNGLLSAALSELETESERSLYNGAPLSAAVGVTVA